MSTLKTDRSFVAGLGHSPDDEVLVEAIIRTQSPVVVPGHTPRPIGVS